MLIKDCVVKKPFILAKFFVTQSTLRVNIMTEQYIAEINSNMEVS